MKRYTSLRHHTACLPPLCAWCGRRADEHLRETDLVHNFLWIQVHMILSLPICKLCDGYVKRLHQAELQLQLLLVALLAPLSAIVIDARLDPSGRADDWIAFGIGSAVLTLVLARISSYVLGRTGLGNRLLRAMVGDAPPGYAGDSAVPGEFVRGAHIRFCSPEFHRRFAELNPHLVEEGQRAHNHAEGQFEYSEPDRRAT